VRARRRLSTLFRLSFCFFPAPLPLMLLPLPLMLLLLPLMLLRLLEWSNMSDVDAVALLFLFVPWSSAPAAPGLFWRRRCLCCLCV
jgi:hypothetical protein